MSDSTTLQTRVDVLEKDLANLRSRIDNADVERPRMQQEIRDARAETRGWAEFALTADKKIGHMSDFMKQIHIDQRAMKETLDRHEVRLDGIDTRLDGIDTRLDGIDTRLDGIDTRLDGIDAKLDEHGARLGGIDAKLVGQGDLLREHGDLLHQILAKLG
jgi:chromosome segregation ATPase